MICTPEFIRVYNETFKFIHENLGYKAVVGYWLKIAPIALEDLSYTISRHLCKTKEYWDKTLTTEGAVYTIDTNCEYLPYVDALTLNIYECPSLKILGDDVYEYYCDHCTVMYQPIFEERGYDYKVERKERGCRIRITKKKSASSETGDTPVPALT
jgi:hypothetical protein